jgi:hypothetical protein
MATSVFISSTSRDLGEYRAAVREALLQAGYHPIDMADFMARAEGARAACLDEVAEADLFVGIYAWRYGFIPKGRKTSITQQEFEEAQKLGKPCFCFVLDEKYEWPVEYREEGKGAELLGKFKAKIDAKLVRTTFTTPDSLAKKVLSSLARWEKEQHKLTLEVATELLAGVSSVEQAQQMLTDVLEERGIEYEIDKYGGYNIPFGTTTLTVQAVMDDQLGLMMDFRADLAIDVDLENTTAEVALNLLAYNWTAPMGAFAIQADNGIVWYSYRLPAALLNPEAMFMCMSYVATIADNLDEQVAEMFPTRPKRRSRRES